MRILNPRDIPSARNSRDNRKSPLGLAIKMGGKIQGSNFRTATDRKIYRIWRQMSNSTIAPIIDIKNPAG